MSAVGIQTLLGEGRGRLRQSAIDRDVANLKSRVLSTERRRTATELQHLIADAWARIAVAEEEVLRAYEPRLISQFLAPGEGGHHPDLFRDERWPRLHTSEDLDRDVAADHACQMGGPGGHACYQPAAFKLTDSWGDTAWSCLPHAEEALLDARGVFLATKDAEGLTAYMARKWRAGHPDRRQTGRG